MTWDLKNEPKVKPLSDDQRRDPDGDLLFIYRYEIAHLLDVFIEWANLQIEFHDWTGDTFFLKIEGP